jgi:hypothetical protein
VDLKQEAVTPRVTTVAPPQFLRPRWAGKAPAATLGTRVEGLPSETRAGTAPLTGPLRVSCWVGSWGAVFTK